MSDDKQTDHPFLRDLPRYVFFTGKGGVGKTSLACATAVHLARRGKRVLLTSTDPASNIGHTFGLAVGNRITAIDTVPGLSALEVDPDEAADEYRASIIDPLRGELSHDELRALTEQLSGSCTTEIASFNKFTGLIADPARESEFDHVVFDTAPTGHTIRLLNLPGEWNEYLERGTGDVSCLGPLAGLQRRKTEYAAAVAALADPARTRLVLVARAQEVSLREAARTREQLREVGLAHPHLVLNALFTPTGDAAASDDDVARAVYQRQQSCLAHLPGALASLPQTRLPMLAVNTVGVDALDALLAPRAESGDSDDVVPEWVPGATSDALAQLSDLIDQIATDSSGLIMCMGKGGVGKTTIAAAVAVGLADRGHIVHLTTTDPAPHLRDTLTDDVPGLTVSQIDPDAAVAAYRERVMRTRGKDLHEQARAALAEDLRSPCTEEVAVFGEFSKAVSRSRREFVVMDTAPTGHTLLLLDTTGSYHRQMAEQMGQMKGFATPMTRLQDPGATRVIVVTLPETTPVLEARALDADLRRASITPWAWVINQSLAATRTTDPLLRARAAAEVDPTGDVLASAERVARVGLRGGATTGANALRNL